MRKCLFRTLVAVILCFSAVPVLTAGARPLEQTKAAISGPIVIEQTKSGRMHVVFRHDKHLQVSCLTCHHKMTAEQDVFVSCNFGSNCHSNTDIADRSPKSYFLAMHTLNSKRSCRGCHAMRVDDYPRLDGCQTCHAAVPPEYR